MNIWEKIKAFFSNAVVKISDILKEVFNVAFKIIISELKDIAMNTVQELKNSDLSGPKKREEAFKRIKDYAITNLVNVSDSEINLIIEVFVKKLKGN